MGMKHRQSSLECSVRKVGVIRHGRETSPVFIRMRCEKVGVKRHGRETSQVFIRMRCEKVGCEMNWT